MSLASRVCITMGVLLAWGCSSSSGSGPSTSPSDDGGGTTDGTSSADGSGDGPGGDGSTSDGPPVDGWGAGATTCPLACIAGDYTLTKTGESCDGTPGYSCDASVAISVSSTGEVSSGGMTAGTLTERPLDCSLHTTISGTAFDIDIVGGKDGAVATVHGVNAHCTCDFSGTQSSFPDKTDCCKTYPGYSLCTK